MKEYKYKIKGVDYSVKINGVEDNIAKVEVNGVEFDVEMEKPIAQPKPVVRLRLLHRSLHWKSKWRNSCWRDIG